ncbi:MAG: flagellar export protein FliJ [Lachnospiraceae bacterium]|nr:flagellar export protein FliJ [Lachnospiraceae bacterium]
MAKFNFRLQGILNIKQKLEEQEKIAYGLAKMQLETEEQRLAMLVKQREQLTEDKAELMSRSIKPHELNLYENAISGVKAAIEEQKQVVIRARREVELAQERLDAAMKERKTYEKLREKAFDAFVEEQNYEEQLEINELVSYRHGRN